MQARRARAFDPRVRILSVEHTDQGYAMPALHFGFEDGDGLNRRHRVAF